MSQCEPILSRQPDHATGPERDRRAEEDAFARLRAAPCFAVVDRWQMNTPFERPTDLQGHTLASLAAPLRRETLTTQRSLLVNRLLYNIYEQNNLYLPATQEARSGFESYYDEQTVAAGSFVRPALERACFEWLGEEIEVSGPWTMDSLRAYLRERLAEYEAAASALCERVEAAARPEQAAWLLLIQLAPDFLSEAAQMARVLPGNFGPLHSELTKIFIDEYGYGVHRTKHSTLFEKTLASVGLSDQIHTYYSWYLPTSLLMTSYFHCVTGNKRRWFEYLGALYWIEAIVPHFNRQFSRTLKRIFGDSVDTGYFDEHIDIDMHHRRMVLEKLIAPTVDSHGPEVIAAMLRGVETSRLLGDLAEGDFLEQMEFCEALVSAPAGGEESPSRPGNDRAKRYRLAAGEFVGPRLWDVDVRFEVLEGRVEIDGGYLAPRPLEAGQIVVVPAGRMLGACAGEGGATVAVSEPPV